MEILSQYIVSIALATPALRGDTSVYLPLVRVGTLSLEDLRI